MAFDEIDIRQLDARLLQITQLLTEIRDALKPISKPDQVIAKADQPIPPPVRLEEWDQCDLDLIARDFPHTTECIEQQIAHLRARKERGEDV